MSEHARYSRRTFQIWMAANGIILVVIAVWLLKPSGNNDPALAGAGPAPGGSAMATVEAAPKLPTKAEIMAVKGQRFGLSSPDVPWNSAEVERISTAAGASPSMIMVFAKWSEEFRIEPIELCYERGALPVLSWEPWAGAASGTSQPKYALAKIINGTYDEYITRFATAVRAARLPIAIRFAHEMNGHWYPWSESMSGNRKGEYVKAWRHVHDIFGKVGVDNAIWIWSPNIIRAVPNVSLSALYPGDEYVDWAGMVGYAVQESTAGPVFEPTLRLVRDITRKPLVITETGARPGSRKPGWIRDFFAWLPKQRDIVGFIWFEYSREQGGTADWRFTSTASASAAFKAGIRALKPAPGPTPG